MSMLPFSPIAKVQGYRFYIGAGPSATGPRFAPFVTWTLTRMPESESVMDAGIFEVEVQTLSLGLTLNSDGTVISLDPRGEAALSVLLGDKLLAVGADACPQDDVAELERMLNDAPRPTTLRFLSREYAADARSVNALHEAQAQAQAQAQSQAPTQMQMQAQTQAQVHAEAATDVLATATFASVHTTKRSIACTQAPPCVEQVL